MVASAGDTSKNHALSLKKILMRTISSFVTQ